MKPHQPSGRWQLGLTLAAITAFFWGTLPVALHIALREMDGLTITWYRMGVSGVLLGLGLVAQGRRPKLPRAGLGATALLCVAVAGLTGNYILYIVGLDLTSPANSQTLIQSAPIFVTLGSIVVFGERFSPMQKAGFLTFLGGLALFCHQQWQSPPDGDHARYALGSAIVVLAATLWATYALAQKQLLTFMPSTHVTFFIYITAACAFAPWAHPLSVLTMSPLGLSMLGYAIFNALAAYLAFAESLNHWQATRIGAIIATTPMITIITGSLGSTLFPAIVTSPRVSATGIAGAALLTLGCCTVALGKEQSS